MTTDIDDPNDPFSGEKSLTDIANVLERAATAALDAGNQTLAAQYAQAAALYRCADALIDIRELLANRTDEP